MEDEDDLLQLFLCTWESAMLRYLCERIAGEQHNFLVFLTNIVWNDRAYQTADAWLPQLIRLVAL